MEYEMKSILRSKASLSMLIDLFDSKYVFNELFKPGE